MVVPKPVRAPILLIALLAGVAIAFSAALLLEDVVSSTGSPAFHCGRRDVALRRMAGDVYSAPQALNVVLPHRSDRAEVTLN